MRATRIAMVLASITATNAAGCEPRFEALTVPPPTAVAKLSDSDGTIDITKGIALGFECVASDRTPCEGATAEVDDPAIASVFSGYVDLLSPSSQGYGSRAGAEPRTIFVIVGRSIGTTTLHVTTEDGDADLSVEVLLGRAGSQ